MNKTLARASWLSLTLLSPVALAAGLGQTTVLSPLSAPLDARIALLDVDDVPVEALAASVAEPSAFGALGLDWSPLLSGVDITPVRQSGRTYLQLTSGQPVDTPWLDVLVTLTTPAGRQTQAVTLLFDPVDYLPATPAAASVPRAPQPVRPAPVEAAPPRPVPAIPGDEIAVAPGDTLWNIALRTRAPGVEAQQMIAALVAANPQTFADGSIDNLRVGQRLRMPSREQALSLSPQEAARSLDARRAAPPPERTAEVAPAEEAPVSVSLPAREVAVALAEPSTLGGGEGVVASDGEPEGREGPVAALDSSSIERLAGLLAPLSALSPLPLAQAAPDERELAALRDEQARQAEEIDTLRREMAGLRETLAAVQTLALAEPAALPSATPAEQALPGVWATLREQWVWLAGLALALLLATMVITRKRRERRWEPAPLVETPRAPVAPAGPRPTPPAGVKAPPPRTEPAVGAAPAPVREPSAARAAPAPVEKPPSPTLPKASVPASEQAARLALAERTPASRETPAKAAAWWDEQADTAMASPEDAPPAPLAEEPEQPLAPKPARDAADYTIDYQPPAHAKTDASAAPALERDEPSSPADSPEWEIEEVAFKPRRRDNN